MNETLRNECKYLKAFQDVSYKELAEFLEIPVSSFYSWLSANYDFSFERQQRLKYIIETIKE